jgi:arylsulfatase A
MRKLLLLALLIAAMAYLGHRALQPLDQGVTPALFVDPKRDALAVGEVVKPLPGTAGQRPPNVIIILADDLGYGDLGIQGSRAIRTPELDRLASEGMRLTNFYASAPVCTPSRAGLLTGRYPLRSGFSSTLSAARDTLLRSATRSLAVGVAKLGMTDMTGGMSAVQGLPLSEITLPEALHEAGYRTLAVGKWHLGDFTVFPQFHPMRHGFDHFFGYNVANDDFPIALWRDEKELVKDVGIHQQAHTREFTEEAIKYIHEWKDQPFFIYLAHKDPHQPFLPSARFAGKSAAGPYGDAVSEFDWSVGEVMRALQSEALADDTLVIVTSDNGPWYEGNPGGLRGRKGQTYEGGFRVPLIAVWPGQVPAGTVSDAPAMNIDFLPTILKLAGLAPPTDRVIDGVDMMPILAGDPAAATAARQRPLYFFHEYDVEALREGRWKFIERNSHYTWPVPIDKDDTLSGRSASSRDYQPEGGGEPLPTLGTWPLLYDMDDDREEAYNTARSNPQVVTQMRQELDAWRKAFLANPRGWK